nr:unnamed protein product [Spirometra erinaceieuropaei]
MDLFVSGCAFFELTTNTEKTVTTYHLPPNVECKSPRITVSGNQLQTVDNFASLSTNGDDESIETFEALIAFVYYGLKSEASAVVTEGFLQSKVSYVHLDALLQQRQTFSTLRLYILFVVGCLCHFI